MIEGEIYEACVGLASACVGLASVALWRCRPIIRAFAIILVKKFAGEEIAKESLPYLLANDRKDSDRMKSRRGKDRCKIEAEYLAQLGCESEDPNTL